MRVPPRLIAPRLAPYSTDLLVRYVVISVLVFALSYLAQQRGTRWLRLALVPPLYAAIWSMSGGIEFESESELFAVCTLSPTDAPRRMEQAAPRLSLIL